MIRGEESLPPSLSLFQSLLQSISLSLSFSPLRREGHQASGDAVPQEESKRPPPSYCFFITYYLCLTDLLQTNGCHMEKERQRRRKEERKEGKALSFSVGLLKFRSVFCFEGRADVFVPDVRAAREAARTSEPPAVSSS